MKTTITVLYRILIVVELDIFWGYITCASLYRPMRDLVGSVEGRGLFG